MAIRGKSAGRRCAGLAGDCRGGGALQTQGLFGRKAKLARGGFFGAEAARVLAGDVGKDHERFKVLARGAGVVVIP